MLSLLLNGTYNTGVWHFPLATSAITRLHIANHTIVTSHKAYNSNFSIRFQCLFLEMYALSPMRMWPYLSHAKSLALLSVQHGQHLALKFNVLTSPLWEQTNGVLHRNSLNKPANVNEVVNRPATLAEPIPSSMGLQLWAYTSHLAMEDTHTIIIEMEWKR